MADAKLLPALLRIPIDQVEPGPNARGDVGDVGELAQSIRTLGMQKPLIVHDLGEGRYRVLDGHRRLAAAKLLRLPHVDAVLRRDAGDRVRIQQQLAMHAQTKSFDPIAEAKALQELMFEHKLTREQIAEAVGRSPGWVRDRISLLQLDEDEQRSVSSGRTPLATAMNTLAQRRRVANGSVPSWPAPAKNSATPQRPHCTSCRCWEVA